MTDKPATVRILPAEYIGEAQIINQTLTIGGLDVRMGDRWCGTVGVYVRRSSRDLSVMEVVMAHHDGLAQEALDVENEEAERYPLGPKEYWRSKMVGTGDHQMTDEEFEADWNEQFDGGED